MTSKALDYFEYNNKEYEILEVIGDSLCSQEDLSQDFKRISLRLIGSRYYSKYLIQEGFLYLDRIHVRSVDLNNLMLSIKGKKVESKSIESHISGNQYIKVSHPWSFSGIIILAGDKIGYFEELGIYGFPYFWHYKKVFMLAFDHGKLISSVEISDQTRKLRRFLNSESMSFKNRMLAVKNFINFELKKNFQSHSEIELFKY